MAGSDKRHASRGTGDNSCTENPTVELGPQRQEDDFKEGGYGWVVVFAVFMLNAHTWGLNSSYAVFLAHYLRTGVFGDSQLGYAFVGGLSISISLLVAPLATVLMGWGRCGTRLTIFIGAVFETIAFVGSSFATELWHILLSQGLSFGVGLGMCFVPSAAVPPQWFVKRRSFASAITASGSGFGGLCYSLATNAMISRVGLPWTFRILAIVCFVVNSAASYFIRDRNKAIGSVHVAFDWRLFKRLPFLLFQAWAFLSLIAYVILVYSIVDYCQSVGLSASQASLAAALFNRIGRPLIGLSSDAVGRLNIANICTLFCGLICMFFWTFAAKGLAACMVFAVLSGSVAGVIWATAAPLCAEIVGIAVIPSALSVTWLVLFLPATFAEASAVALRRPGPGAMYIGAFVFGWALRAWKVGELGEAQLTKEQRELATRDDGVVASLEHGPQAANQKPTSAERRRAVFRGLWAIVRV
ncbi:MFS general substrate transporter [Durotheca rogersii]|uniref:MFS general substrate transporter n=1 Tax=Durotheca rogersii TaxID=419775 RepID=UPI00221EDA43|nr:MFS general substrate transporter [Durotheca rogersii]KAI5862678.1 MFS general substrate transporter [Durotheca rogersii]